MPQTPLTGLLGELWHDLQTPNLIWQILALVICLLLAKFAERQVRKNTLEEGASVSREIGFSGLKRLSFPLVALALVLVARILLRVIGMRTGMLNVAVPLLTSLVAIRTVFFILRHSFNPTSWLMRFERWFSKLVWFGVALYLTGFHEAVVNFLDDITFTIGKQQLNLWILTQGFATVVVALLVALWIGSLIEARLANTEEMDSSLRVVLARLARTVLVCLSVLIALPLVGIDLTTLSVFGGALGVGLGFGLQKIASNYVSGFIILFDRSIRIGNMIDVSGDRGIVTQITARYTVLKNSNGVESLVPNENLVSSVVRNETYSDPLMWVKLTVQVSYAGDLELAMRLLREAAAKQVRVVKTPAPAAFVINFADSGINLELGFWISDPENGTRQLISDINLDIWREFKQHGVEIPYPQREVRLIGDKA